VIDVLQTVKVVLREITYRIVSIYSPYDAHMGLLPRVSEVFPDPAHILRDELFGLRVVNRVEVQELLYVLIPELYNLSSGSFSTASTSELPSLAQVPATSPESASRVSIKRARLL